jgi:trk system potassium uptake protein TrkH
VPEGFTAVLQPVRPAVLALYLGQVALVLGLLSAVPLGVSLVLGEWPFAFRYLVVMAVLMVAGAGAVRIDPPERIQTNEAMVVVVLAFLIAPLIMTYPLAASGLPLVDVFFEAMSAVTTTGLSTSGPAGEHSPAFLFGRAWMQWYGGLGMAVLSVALLMGPHAAARRLMEPLESENLATTARRQARHVLLAYAGLTLAGVLCYWLATGRGFEGLLVILASVSTGGFAPTTAGLAEVPGYGASVAMVFSLFGALPLVLWYLALRGRPMELLRDGEARVLAALVLLATIALVLTFSYAERMPWPDALWHGAVLAVSAQSTTGFSTVAVGSLSALPMLVLCLAMVTGGCSGSTAGGVKVLRLLVIVRMLQYFVRRTAMPPHAAFVPRLAGRPLEMPDIERATLVVTLYAAVTALSWLAFLVYGYDPLPALVEVVSALSTVGLSTGIARPDLEAPLKLVLCADMLLGRLELLAVLVLLYPRTWGGKRG